MIVRGKRNIKQDRNWVYFNFSVESPSFIFNNFKTEKFSVAAISFFLFVLFFVPYVNVFCHIPHAFFTRLLFAFRTVYICYPFIFIQC